MPILLETPVLQVDANLIHKIDTANPCTLFCMWTVFARCRDSIHEGRRLENLSWRVWNRETFCCDSSEPAALLSSATSQPQDIRLPIRQDSADDMPQLSKSVESLADEEAVDFSNTESDAMDIVRPMIRRQDSWTSNRNRGKERHLTSDDLEKMVVSIIETKQPLTTRVPSPESYSVPCVPCPTPSTPPHAMPEANDQNGSNGSTSEGSPCRISVSTSTASLQQSTPETTLDITTQSSRVVITRPLHPAATSPSKPAVARTLQPPFLTAIPQPSDAPAPKAVQSKKHPVKFALGSSDSTGTSVSLSDGDQHLQAKMTSSLQPQPQQVVPKKKVFSIGESSMEENMSLKSALASPKVGSLLSGKKKTASFNNELMIRTYQDSAVVSEDEEDADDVDESAIDDIEESDWEDSVEDSRKSSVEEKFNFQRVDSAANLASRRSLLTLALSQRERAARPGMTASQSTSALPRARASLHPQRPLHSPNDSDDGLLIMKSSRGPPRPSNPPTRTKAQPISTVAKPGAMSHAIPMAALSPKTTRRNMLSTELTTSLRRSLLWERSSKVSTATAALKRRHTTQDLANLKEHPEVPFMKKSPNEQQINGNWVQYLDSNEFSGYHYQGW